MAKITKWDVDQPGFTATNFIIFSDSDEFMGRVIPLLAHSDRALVSELTCGLADTLSLKERFEDGDMAETPERGHFLVYHDFVAPDGTIVDDLGMWHVLTLATELPKQEYEDYIYSRTPVDYRAMVNGERTALQLLYRPSQQSELISALRTLGSDLDTGEWENYPATPIDK